jgi:1-aminocyclopropane-1-carboxylate deaminase
VVAIIPSLKNISLDHWDHPSFSICDLQVEVLRLDKIHPEISGNKWFKLKYYLERATQAQKQKLISFGGAYSNHLLALASAASMYGFSSIGLIRGEEPAKLSPTLVTAKEFGMELRFLPRTTYNQQKKSAFLNDPDEYEPDAMLIPEGGAGIYGIRGAEEILSGIPIDGYSHICCAVGTGTTLAGIINSTATHQKKIGVSVLKGTHDFEPLNNTRIKNPADLENVQIIHEDHFGGYAKCTNILIDFMNQTYSESGIPTDFVYTGKLFYSVSRMAKMKVFPTGSRILVLHTGGLSGNRSLAPGLLQF